MCEYQYSYEGQRSYGGNIPDSAQGAYFPGDEPCEKCRYSGNRVAPLGEQCPHENNLSECHAYSRTTTTLCPHCLKDASDKITLFEHEKGEFRCSECDSKYEPHELAAALSDRAEDYYDHMMDSISLYDENKRLKEQLEEVRRAVAA